MKRIYIKPETEYTSCNTISFIAGSTEWHMKPDGNENDGSSNIGDGEGHDPNAEAKNWSMELWTDEEEENF